MKPPSSSRSWNSSVKFYMYQLKNDLFILIHDFQSQRVNLQQRHVSNTKPYHKFLQGCRRVPSSLSVDALLL